MDELSFAVEMSADSDDVSDDVSISRPPTRGHVSRDHTYVVDGVDGLGGYRSIQRRSLSSNNIQLMTSADDDSDDGESYHRNATVICIR